MGLIWPWTCQKSHINISLRALLLAAGLGLSSLHPILGSWSIVRCLPTGPHVTHWLTFSRPTHKFNTTLTNLLCVSNILRSPKRRWDTCSTNYTRPGFLECKELHRRIILNKCSTLRSPNSWDLNHSWLARLESASLVTSVQLSLALKCISTTFTAMLHLHIIESKTKTWHSVQKTDVDTQ